MEVMGNVGFAGVSSKKYGVRIQEAVHVWEKANRNPYVVDNGALVSLSLEE